MTPGRSMKLSESVPLDDEATGGFVIAWLLSSVLSGLLVLWISTDAGGPFIIPFWSVGFFICFLIFILNMSPIATTNGFVQYLFLMVINGTIYYSTQTISTTGQFYMSLFIGLPFCTLMMFALFRVNWWFYWQNSSSRTLEEKVLCSVFFTVLYPFGAIMGLYRLIGIGVQAMTTEFVMVEGKTIEAIPQNDALVQHKVRMEAVRTGARAPAANKDDVSGTL